ncbi:MAG: polysaccharide lyase family 7 protein [Reichenbachiella sp.]|uniref:polysaccharide lyase family 7 protein n=1 Tax=Reichenbachiella sp. TaxID=2184521 RepID=UPI00326352A6
MEACFSHNTMHGKTKQNHSGQIVLGVACLLFIGLFAWSNVMAQSNSDHKLPNIDLSNWKVTLPVGQGKPIEVEPPEILSYASNETLEPFMYNDSTDGSLVFYTYPGAVTGNTKYSRTELREQMTPGSNKENWTFEQGARMKGTLSISEISKTPEGKFDRTIVMQIHGRLTNEQKDQIGQKDNNAPPILKIYWHKGYVRVKTKELKDINGFGMELLPKEAWKDDKGYNFPEYVGNKPFTLEIIATKGRLEVILNEKYSKVYQSIHMRKWGAFENYFKAGNYLQTKNPNGFAKVKYYALEISHSDVVAPARRKKKKRVAK